MKGFALIAGIALSLASPTVSAHANDWNAFSVIEEDVDQKTFKETVYLFNATSNTITLRFPNFQFIGHDDTPAQSISPMGNVVLKQGEAVRFVHIVPVGRKNGFADSMGIEGVDENIPIKRLVVKKTFGNKEQLGPRRK